MRWRAPSGPRTQVVLCGVERRRRFSRARMDHARLTDQGERSTAGRAARVATSPDAASSSAGIATTRSAPLRNRTMVRAWVTSCASSDCCLSSSWRWRKGGCADRRPRAPAVRVAGYVLLRLSPRAIAASWRSVGRQLGHGRDGLPVLFDPAVYFGDREADIAMTRLFGGFGHAFYAAYQAPGRSTRRPARDTLYNLYHVLNHFNLFGGGYLAQAGHDPAPARRARHDSVGRNYTCRRRARRGYRRCCRDDAEVAADIAHR